MFRPHLERLRGRLQRARAERRRASRNTRTAIAWLTHFHDTEAQAAFARLAAEAYPWGTVVQFRDGIGFSDDDPAGTIILLSEREVAEASPHRYAQWAELVRAGKYVGGCTDIVHMAIAARLRDYEHIWLIESDVDFSGNWGEFFEAFSTCDADILGTNLYPKDLSETWYHWRWFAAPSEFDPAHAVRAFFPVVRYSQRFVRTFLDEVMRGWSGHYEAVWPTLARYKGLIVQDIGGCGPQVPNERRGKWYTSTDRPELDDGTMRFRPPVAESYFPANAKLFPANHLCHPIKTAAWKRQSKQPSPRRPAPGSPPTEDIDHALRTAALR